MKYCLVKDGRAVEGNDYGELLLQLPIKWAFDCDKYTLLVDGREDTISYSKDFTPDEFRAEALKRVLELARRGGWRLYRGDF